MAYGTLQLQEKWFSEEHPTNPHRATATLTFEGIPVVTETVTIGTEVYEFVASAEDVQEGNIAVVLGETLTADKAVEELAGAINANSDLVTATFDKTDDICVISCKKVGTEGNTIEVETTTTNASFGVDVTKLSGGQFGVPCPEVNTLLKDDNYYYLCTKEGNESNVEWKRFTLASF